jgi:hypothetical protein
MLIWFSYVQKKIFLIYYSPFSFHTEMYICLLVRCQLHTIWPTVLPLNLTYVLRFLPPLPWATLPYTYFYTPCTKSYIQLLSFRSFIQGIHPGPMLLVIFRNKLIFYGEELLATHPTPNPQAGGQPLVSCLGLLIQYIRSYPPYLVDISICILGTCHDVVTRDPPNIWVFSSALFWNFINQCSSHKMREQISYSCKTIVKL